MDNLIFLGGPHGSGKTTLENLLVASIPNSVLPELSTRTPKFYSDVPEHEIDFFHRQALKHAQRAIENFEYWEIARANPDKLVIGNRCVYDVLAYGEAYLQVGWVSEGEKNILDNGFWFLVGDDLRDPRTIILNPGFEVCRRHLEERWKNKRKKFMEEDMDYLMAVCNAYEKYKDFRNVFYIGREIDLDSGRDVAEISEWIESCRKPAELVGV
ncbi:MAG: deoxynucleoside kinase [Nanoarchaeota archaeon]|nr:deoxynucleoside kinase [Nanoarchaeota archaeon]